MAKARITYEQGEEVTERMSSGWILNLQWCTYHHEDGTEEHGYRFIYRDNDGKLHPQRGQARIPDLNIAQRMIQRAIDGGWGNHRGER